MARISYQIGTDFRIKQRRIGIGRQSAGTPVQPPVQFQRVPQKPVNPSPQGFGRREFAPAIGGLPAGNALHQQKAPCDGQHLYGVTATSGKVIMFDPPGGVVRDGRILAQFKRTTQTIPLADVQRVLPERRQNSTFGATILCAGIVAGAFTGVFILLARAIFAG